MKFSCCAARIAWLVISLGLGTALLADELHTPSLRNDVLPVLTRFGCNQGSCHGKLAGQNGFRLSLRGYAAEWDYGWIVREFDGRRINRASPADSLLLKKPTGQIPHGGGRLFEVGSPGYQVLHDWIAAGAPGPMKDEAAAERIEVTPRTQTLRPSQTVQLVVNAFYSDGRQRDVTWLSKFISNDDNVVQVTAAGLVMALRAGETTVRVHFDTEVEAITCTTAFDQQVDPQLYVTRRNLIDQHVMNKLASLRIPPSPPADDATFLRRAYLDAIGTLPTVDETTRFMADTSSDKRQRLIEQLLERPEWVDYWTLQLCDLLQNRKERDHDVRGAKSVRAMHAWVRQQVANNRPWDEIARRVLTAIGDSAQHPEIGYYVVTMGEQRQAENSEVVASVAQAFLGTRIGCAKCHNHPLERYTQDDYYHFAAFFARQSFDRKNAQEGATVLKLVSEDEQRLARQIEQATKKIAELESQVAGKEGDEVDPLKKQIGQQVKNLANFQKQLTDARVRPVTVRQPRTGQQLGPQGLDRLPANLQPGEDPRGVLARWMTDPANEQFAGAMVNRLWKHFFSVGLVEPVDDLRASNPPSNCELFAGLTREFVGSGYNLKHVMRLVLNSRTYQLAATSLPQNQDDRRFYSHYYARRLPAEVLLDAISQSVGVPDQFPGYPTGLRAIQLPDPGVNSYFLALFGRSNRVTACACERMGDVTLPQLLHLQCGDGLVQKFNDEACRLKPWLAELTDDAALLERVFLATLSRRPSDDQRNSVLASIAGYESREEAFRDVYWALLNTKEFGFNH